MKKIKVLCSVVFIFIILSACTSGTQISESETFLEQARADIEKNRKADFSLMLRGDLQDVEVEVEQVSHDFLFGCIIFDLVSHGKSPENEQLFRERFSHLFNFAVFPFYWAGYEPQEGVTKQQQIMQVAQWCIENGITCKGHPLAWTHTAGTPSWLANYSEEESRRLLEQRIKTIVEQFDGTIDIWDVLNEAIHTVNWTVAMAENSKEQDNRYVGHNYMSDDVAFIDSCFRWANSANPDAHLILNEFDIVYNEQSRQRFYHLLSQLLEKGSPVKGIGIQAHEPYKGRIWYSPRQINETLETYAAFNLPLHLTELIPVSNGDSIMGGYRSGVWTPEAQAEFAEMLYTLAFAHPGVASINWWGMSDANIWQEGGGLVDADLAPKPVYTTLDRLINKEWKTTLTGLKPDKDGMVSFHGFKGGYAVKAIKNGEAVKTWNISSNDLLSGQNVMLEF